MLFGEPPFAGSNLGELILAIYQQEVSFPHHPFVSKHIVVLLQKMLVKDPQGRASWSEIFNYPIRDVPQKTGKESTTTVDNSGMYHSKDLTASLRKRGEREKTENSQRGSDIVEKPAKNTPTQPLRNTFAVNSSFRSNFSRDLLVKNHYKSAELAGMAVELMGGHCEEGLRLAWLLLRNVERDLRGTVESAKKELSTKGEEGSMRHLLQSAEEESHQIREVLVECEECLTEEGVRVEAIEGEGVRLLRGMLERANEEEREWLVLLCRLADYFRDGLVIKKETFDKMSRDRVLINVHQKMQAIK